MKKLNYKLYFFAIMTFLPLPITGLFLNREALPIFLVIGGLSLFWSLNTASILFYKSLNTEKEILKFFFSFINVILFMFAVMIISEKIRYL